MANKPSKRLGKGLSALLGDYVTEGEPQPGSSSIEAEEAVARLPVAALRPNPFQPRREVAREKLDELVASIRENGLLQPIVVRPGADDRWEIVAGERRWRAVSELGWSRVPVVVREIDDATMLVLALVENLQREELGPLEEARAYQRLMEEFGLSQGEVAETVGRDRSTVANTVRLLALPDPVQELLGAGRIAAGHARALLGLEDAGEAVKLARAVAERGLSVRDVERRVRRAREDGGRKRPSKSRAKEPDHPYARQAEQRLGRALGTAVRVRLEGETRGRIEIPFHDADDFDRILGVILGPEASDEERGIGAS